jgi:hypothetical protein
MRTRMISWRMTSFYYPSCKHLHTALANYTHLEMLDVFSLCVVTELSVAPTNSSPPVSVLLQNCLSLLPTAVPQSLCCCRTVCRSYQQQSPSLCVVTELSVAPTNSSPPVSVLLQNCLSLLPTAVLQSPLNQRPPDRARKANQPAEVIS